MDHFEGNGLFDVAILNYFDSPRQTIFELESGVRANGLCAAPIIKGNAVDKIPPREIEVGDEAPHNVSAAVDYCRFHNITGHGGIIHLKGCHGKES